jgi:hypothetical protein
VLRRSTGYGLASRSRRDVTVLRGSAGTSTPLDVWLGSLPDRTDLR